MILGGSSSSPFFHQLAMLGEFNKDVYETTYLQLCERMGLQIEADKYNKKSASFGRTGSKSQQKEREKYTE